RHWLKLRFRLVANQAHVPLNEQLVKLSSKKIQILVNATYDWFCSSSKCLIL
ncbi:hypothetical protein VP01_4451g1, partial [Puccinia sorghi]